jgi:hypothetical protein
MNWYKKILSQLWEIPTKGDYFDEMIRKLYELQYKRQAIKTSDFSGVPKRKENILIRIDNELNKSIEDLKYILVQVFKTWLENHALNDPDLWAEKHISYEEEYGSNDSDYNTSKFENFLFEYARWNGINIKSSYNQRTNLSEVFRYVIDEICDDIENYKSLDNLFSNIYEVVKEEKLSELSNIGYEEFGDIYGKEFSSIEEAEKYIDEDVDNSDKDELFRNWCDGLDSESFISYLSSNYVNIAQFLKESYKYLVFPSWYGHWKPQGIDQTRSNIERIYNMLIQSNDLNNSLVAIDFAINAVHQTGSMLDYVETYGDTMLLRDIDSIKELLSELSGYNTKNVKQWNKELREVGVKVK